MMERREKHKQLLMDFLSLTGTAILLGILANRMAPVERKINPFSRPTQIPLKEGMETQPKKNFGRPMDGKTDLDPKRSDPLAMTKDGPAPIETLKVGDLVLSRDEATGALANKRIEKVFIYENRPYYELTVAAEDGTLTVVTVTDDHPVHVERNAVGDADRRAGAQRDVACGEVQRIAAACGHGEIAVEVVCRVIQRLDVVSGDINGGAARDGERAGAEGVVANTIESDCARRKRYTAGKRVWLSGVGCASRPQV